MEEGGEHTSLLVKVRRTCCRLASAESELALNCLPRNGLFPGLGDHARQEAGAKCGARTACLCIPKAAVWISKFHFEFHKGVRQNIQCKPHLLCNP